MPDFDASMNYMPQYQQPYQGIANPYNMYGSYPCSSCYGMNPYSYGGMYDMSFPYRGADERADNRIRPFFFFNPFNQFFFNPFFGSPFGLFPFLFL